MKLIKKTKNSRNSNIELLRILSIVLIVISHWTVHNGVSSSSLKFSFNRIFLEITTLGNIGTILFVLITGYYMCNSKKKLVFNRIFKLWLQVVFYSFLIYIIFVFTGLAKFNIMSLIGSIFPITFEQYWFVTSYFVLIVFHRYINILIDKLDRKDHLKLIFIGFFLFSIVNIITSKTLYANDFVQFIFYYIMGAYFYKYKKNYFTNAKKCKIIIISCIALLILSTVTIDLLSLKFEFLGSYSIYFFLRSSPLIILLSISIFNLFVNKKTFYNGFINKLSSCVFGVYLLSDNNYIRGFLWHDILKNYKYVNSIFLILHMILSVVFVFIVCVIVELIRQRIFKFTNSKKIKLKIEKYEKKINRKISSVF